MVFATAVRLLGNVPDAEDAAQTVFLRAFQRYAQLAVSPAAGGWLKTTTRNVCFNHLSRYRARWKFFSELDTPGADTTFESTLESQVSRALGTGGRGTPRASRTGGPQSPRSSARAAGAVPFRGAQLPADRRGAQRVGRQGEDRHPSRPRGAQAPPDGRCTRITTNSKRWRIASCGGCRSRAHRTRCCRGSWPRSRPGRSVRGTRARGLRGQLGWRVVSLAPLALLVYALWSWSLPAGAADGRRGDRRQPRRVERTHRTSSSLHSPGRAADGCRLRSLRPGVELRAPGKGRTAMKTRLLLTLALLLGGIAGHAQEDRRPSRRIFEPGRARAPELHAQSWRDRPSGRGHRRRRDHRRPRRRRTSS